jgi:bidirectional [NiFe] hydrogenase diaphorase subunit
MARITIDGVPLEFDGRLTVLEAAKKLKIRIPTLCYNDFLTPYGGCRICMVEAAVGAAPGKSRLVPACSAPAEDGMTVVTDSPRVIEARRFIIELFLARCPNSDTIQNMARELGIGPGSPVPGSRGPASPEPPSSEPGSREPSSRELDPVGRYLLERAPRREDTNCILCGLCVRVCQQIPQRSALSFKDRGIIRKPTPPFEKVAESCVGCGSCAYVCPTHTITIEAAG